MKQFTLQEKYQLPYAYDYLWPAMSPEVMSKHYNNFFLKYYEKLETELASHDSSINETAQNLVDLVRFSFGKPHLLQLFNNAGQIINHIYFFESFVNKEISRQTAIKLKETYRNASAFLSEMLKCAKDYGFGSSWLWLVLDNTNNIRSLVTPNAFTIHNLDYVEEVLCCIDLWEHSYCLDYDSERALFIEKALTKTNIYQYIK